MSEKREISVSLLITKYRSGNREAGALLIKRWHPRLCRQANWYIKDKDAAMDVAQETWGIILKLLNTLRDVNKFGSWALTIVTRLALDLLRKQKREYQNLKKYDNYLNTVSDNPRDGIAEDIFG